MITEKDFEVIFTKFLIEEKGYPKESLLTQMPIMSSGGDRYQPDLVVMDLSIGDYLLLIEFKTSINPSIKNAAKEQIKKYLSVIKANNILGYLVYPINDIEFQILILSENDEWKSVDKSEFPEYSSLSMKAKTDEKLYQKVIEEKKLNELEIKKRKSRQVAYFTMISMLLGISASFISIFFSENRLFSTKDSYSNCCDSLNVKIVYLEKQISDINIESHNTGQVVDTIIEINNTQTYKAIDERLQIIENGISTNPENVLNILQVKNQINDIKKNLDYIEELEKVKIDALNSRFDLLNSWMLAILITVFGGVIGFVFTNLRK